MCILQYYVVETLPQEKNGNNLATHLPITISLLPGNFCKEYVQLERVFDVPIFCPH